MEYPNDLNFLDRHVWANSVDPDQTAPRGVVSLLQEEQSDQGLHCLPFRLQLLDKLLCSKTILL